VPSCRQPLWETDKVAGWPVTSETARKLPTRFLPTLYTSASPYGIHSARPFGVNERGNETTILLVDDDIEVLKALKKVLEKDGFDVLPHSDAMDAIRFINETKRRFDLIITDVSMPVMNGAAFLSAVKAAFPKVPVIVITAFGNWGQYMETIRNGACEYLNKPLDKAEFLTVVRRALKNGKQTAIA
jgi:DNA-binding NtrC family response regulator